MSPLFIVGDQKVKYKLKSEVPSPLNDKLVEIKIVTGSKAKGREEGGESERGRWNLR